MTPVYRWEIQTPNYDTGHWHFTDQHPRGGAESTSSPGDFAAEVASEYGRFAGDGRFRVVVWSGDEVAAMREHGPGAL